MENYNKTQSFIEKAIKIHGNKYDYSISGYIRCNIKIEIKCPDHGVFKQKPLNHLRGKGCPKCGNILRSKSNTCTTEEFVEKAIKVHGNRYDYSKVSYINNKTKILIGCPVHGYFLQTPLGHLKGRICKKCAMDNLREITRITLSDFINKAKNVHGDKYDYSHVVYQDAHTKMKIICKKHGFFYQTSNDHLNGCGCPACGYEVVAEKRILSQKKFINKAKKIYKNINYNYEKTIYFNALTDITVTCPVHGDFKQNAHSFLQGHGCQKCGYGSYTLTLSECLDRFRAVHGDVYNYSKVKYVNLTTKVCIICLEHGCFWKRPINHIQGQGCPNCNISYGELEIRKWLQLKNIEFKQQYKFIELNPNSKFMFDFFLLKNNIAIEYDGEQHYRPVRFNGISLERAIKIYELNKIRDKIKNNFCKDNDIKLIRIGYKDFKDIPYILSEEIK